MQDQKVGIVSEATLSSSSTNPLAAVAVGCCCGKCSSWTRLWLWHTFGGNIWSCRGKQRCQVLSCFHGNARTSSAEQSSFRINMTATENDFFFFAISWVRHCCNVLKESNSSFLLSSLLFMSNVYLSVLQWTWLVYTLHFLRPTAHTKYQLGIQSAKLRGFAMSEKFAFHLDYRMGLGAH